MSEPEPVKLALIPFAKLKVVVAVLLCLATLGLFGSDARFGLERPEILPNLSLRQGFDYWQTSRGGIALRRGADPTAEFTADENVRVPHMAQVLLDPHRFTYIRVSGEVKLDDVRPGPEPWQQGAVKLRIFDRNGGILWYWPYEILRLSGTTDWREFEAVLPVGREVAAMRLYVYLGGLSGKMSVRRLSMDAVTENQWFKIVRAILLLLWCMLALWIFVPLFVRKQERIVRRISILFGLAVLVAVVSPQPHLRNFTDAIQAGIAQLFVWEPPNANSGGADVWRESLKETQEPTIANREEGNKPQRSEVQVLRLIEMEKTIRARFPKLENISHLVAFTLLILVFLYTYPNTPRRHLIFYLVVVAFASEVLQNFSITRTARWRMPL